MVSDDDGCSWGGMDGWWAVSEGCQLQLSLPWFVYRAGTVWTTPTPTTRWF